VSGPSEMKQNLVD